MKKLVTISVFALAGLVACKKDVQKEASQIVEEPGINLAFMDPSVKPADDFFKYVNGKWLESTEIPDDQTRWGSFNELRKKTDTDALSVLRAAMSDNKDLKKIEILPGSDQEKAVHFFETILDTLGRDKQGLDPVIPYLDKVESIHGINDLQEFLIEMEPLVNTGFFGFRVAADPKDSNINSAFIRPGRLGLPDRDYYVKDDADSKEKREKYVAYITKMLQFLGDPEDEANQQANQILAFETRLAEPRMDKVDRRDARKRYNPRSIAELQKMVPAINWDNYFKEIGVTKLDTVIVTEVKYMERLQTLLSENRVSDWKAFLRWTIFNNASNKLTGDLEKASWDFYNKELRGAKKQRPKDEEALQVLNRSMGEALGKLYVEKHFPPEAKVRAEKMIKNILAAFEVRINNLKWMSEDTKKSALEKLKATRVKIAYPDVWKDYSALKIDDKEEGGSYFQNVLNISSWNFQKDLKKLGNPVDRNEWFMAPQIVNAYFNPSNNEIVFPAAILQPPFFNFNADDAVNYGGIGAVIGHEISHSFDDSGSRYDKNGNLNNWWTEEDLKQFEALGKSLADQYSAIEVLPDTYINGAFTLGENIGDLGGLNVAYDALQLSFKENGRPENIDGFTPEQRFFMSWATVWRTKAREDAIKTQIKTDPHSPGMNRAVQPLLNIDAFYDAFNIQETDSMYLEPGKRVKIW